MTLEYFENRCYIATRKTNKNQSFTFKKKLSFVLLYIEYNYISMITIFIVKNWWQILLQSLTSTKI